MSDEKEILVEKVRGLVDTSKENWIGGSDNTANLIKEPRYLSEPMSADEAKRQMSARSRRGFLVGGIAALTTVFGWRWISDETKYNLYHRAFAFNEKVSQFFYSPRRLAPEFPPERITRPNRVNGDIGMTNQAEVTVWKLTVSGINGSATREFTIDEIRAMPRTEMTTEFKCIEGWSTIVQWAGVRFSDLAAACGLTPDTIPEYVSLTTPDKEYYVGWDTAAIMHPQTLLAYEMNGEPLSIEHGAPLRLASSTKYGIKQIKRVGNIEFTSVRPKDYWNQPENGGYDWYAGL